MEVITPLIAISMILALGLGIVIPLGLAARKKMFPAMQPERLQLIHRNAGAGLNAAFTNAAITEIYRDMQTGVQYLVVRAGSGVSITPMLDREGKPLAN
jgi:Flp pilus assembly protein TadB